MLYLHAVIFILAVTMFSGSVTATNYSLPPLSAFCTNCRQLPNNAYQFLNSLQNALFPPSTGPTASKCGDGICNTLMGESCGNCPNDCGTCKYTMALQGCVQKNQASFTFDDGPSLITPSLLAELKKLNVKATFFVNAYRVNDEVDPKELNKSSGWTAGSNFAKIIKQAYDQGHVIGSHTYSHLGLVNGTGATFASANNFPLEAMRMQILANDMTIKDIIGKAPTVFRPPYLELNLTVLNLLDSMGYIPVVINADTFDYVHQALNASGAAVQAILTSTKQAITSLPPNQGPILLQHDLYQTTSDSLAPVVEYLKQMKYDIVSLDTCLGIKPTDMYRDEAISPFNKQPIFTLLSALKNSMPASNGTSVLPSKPQQSSGVMPTPWTFPLFALASLLLSLFI